MKRQLVGRARRIAALAALAAGAVLLMGSYEGGAVEGGGAIAGTVRLEGTPPALEPHVVEDEAFVPVCGETVRNEQVIVGADGSLANVVVWIDGITSGALAEPRNLRLDQIGCVYTPHVAATTRGSEMVITSSDSTLHNTHGIQERRTVFNLALPNAGIEIPRRLTRPGIVAVQCDAGHTWMSAFVHVFEHPYFGVTGEDGSFTLSDVPAGTYTVRAWHERYGELTSEVTVTTAGTATWDPSFTAEP